MSRTVKNHKGLGYEFWGRRPPNNMQTPGRSSKRLTHKLERIQARQEIQEGLDLLDEYEEAVRHDLESQEPILIHLVQVP